MSSETWDVVSYEDAEGDDAVSLSREFTTCALVDALHDSPLRSANAARCFLGTHARSKQDVSRWLATYSPRNHQSGRQATLTRVNLLWVHGAAGTGKTTLMQTLADALLPFTTASVSFSDDLSVGPPTYESDAFGSIGVQYGGTAVFFSKEYQLTNASKIFTTIALGLARRLPPLGAFIQSAFDADKDLFQHTSHIPLKEQVEALIINPTKSWVEAEDGDVDVDLIIIVDGLDECDDKEIQVEIIGVVRDVFAKTIPGVRWLWVFSSRTNMRLREALMGRSAVASPKADEIFVGPASDAEMDAFLSCGFAKIRTAHEVVPVAVDGNPQSGSGSDDEWPTIQDKDAVKWQAAGLYAAAASILDYLAKPDDDPRARIVLIDNFIGNKDPGLDHPFTKLDRVYRDILAQVPETSIVTTKRVLGAISCLQPSSHEQNRPTVSQIAELFDITGTEVHQSLYDLHSVISAPNKRLRILRSSPPFPPFEDGVLGFHHPSFDQFLRTPPRSLDWALHLESVHMDLARCCLKKLASGVSSKFLKERWYINCWRTGKDTEAALGILPDLFEFDYSGLQHHSTVDRYFVEWLLYLQESTMSEYQLLNPGPLIKLRATRRAAPDKVDLQSTAEPSASSSTGTTATPKDETDKIHPPRRSYILGFEPSKQVYLVPYYDEKVQERTELGLVIGPGLKHWDFIRGFKVVRRDLIEYPGLDEEGDELAAVELEEVRGR